MKKSILTLLSFSLLLACQTEKKQKSLEMGNLQISTEKPHPGETVSIYYKTKDSLQEKPQAIAYYIAGNSSYPVDISLSKKDSRYQGKLNIPDTVSAVAFSFKNGLKYDSDAHKGYILPLYNENDEELPQSTVGSAWFKLVRGSMMDIDVSTDSVYKVMNSSYEKYPELRNDWTMTLINLANDVDKDRAEKLMAQRLNKLKNQEQRTEKQFSELQRIYTLQKEENAADSISKLAIAQYPKGNLARRNFIKKMQQAKSLEEKQEVLENYNSQIGKAGSEKDYLLSVLASAYQDEGDLENFKKYAGMQDNPLQQASSLNNVAWNHAEKGENLDIAQELSKKSLDLVEQANKDPEAKPEYFSQQQFKEQLQGSKEMYADTYALILHKQGDTKKALNYQKIAVGKEKNPDFNERYVQFLLADEQYDKALSKAEKYIENNTATKKVKDYLETAYKKQNTDAKNFDNYLADLEKTARDKALKELRGSMINEEAPQFKLTNLKGEEIALADFKGKTIILDFWATWCGPCKNSFPGMQMAVDKYKDDPNVEFFFVDTWESNSGKEREKSVSNFIKDNNYSFHVLMDTPVEEGSSSYKVVSAYEVDGIPTKFVVGPDGRIKFKAVGFDGNTEGLAQEIEMMVSLAQS